MDARKAEMDEDTMKLRIQHMQMGKKSMLQCQMMMHMKDVNDKSADASKAPQKEPK